MLTYVVAFILSGVTSYVLTPILREFALRHGVVDAPTQARKVHAVPIPRIGGVAIAVAFFVPVLALVAWDNKISAAYYSQAGPVIGLLVGSFAMVALGLVDDVRGLAARHKFVFQVLVATLVYALGYRIDTIANPFGAGIDLGLLSYPATVFWIVGITNAINLIDGLDGLASGISLFTVLTLFILAVINDNPVAGLATIAMAGALVGFLRYNFNPASIFMGDSGSLFVGFVLAITGISGTMKSSTVVSLLIPILALGLPIMDTTLAIVRRFIGGRPIFSADREHIHHKLLDRGLSHRQVVLVLYAGGVFLGLGALALMYANGPEAAMILGAFGLAIVVFSRVLGLMSWESMAQAMRYGLLRQQRLRGYLEEFGRTRAAIEEAPTVDEALDRLVDLAKATDVEAMDCELTVIIDGAAHDYGVHWPAGGSSFDGPGLRRLIVPVEWRSPHATITGRVDFRWNCDEKMLQLPESICYEWLVMVVRDRVLALAEKEHRPAAGVRLVTSRPTAS